LAGLDLQSVFPETDDKIATVPLGPDLSKHAQFINCMGEEQVTVQDASNTAVRRA
jgi:hypothetical protein